MTKHTILSAALALGLATAAFAQAPIERQQPGQAPSDAPQQQGAAPDAGQPPMHHGHGHHNPHMQAVKLSQRLNLSPDQTAKIEPILAARDEQMRNLKANTALTDEQRHHEMHQIMKSTQTQFAAVLTPDQLQQMREMRREHKQHGGQAQQPAPQQS